MESPVIKFLQSEGYTHLVQTKHYGLVGIKQFAFTYGLMIGLNEHNCHRRYCYPSEILARVGLQMIKTLDESDDPPFDPPDPYWIKRKGDPYETSNPLQYGRNNTKQQHSETSGTG